MHSAYVPVIGLALTGFLLLVVRAAVDRILSRFYPDEVLDCAPMQVVNTVVGAAAWLAGGVAAVLAAFAVSAGA